ncbi:hypothetical protein GQ457_05G009420 [Hibiscus cannabinus]
MNKEHSDKQIPQKPCDKDYIGRMNVEDMAIEEEIQEGAEDEKDDESPGLTPTSHMSREDETGNCCSSSLNPLSVSYSLSKELLFLGVG